jgi:hypothetical protein
MLCSDRVEVPDGDIDKGKDRTRQDKLEPRRRAFGAGNASQKPCTNDPFRYFRSFVRLLTYLTNRAAGSAGRTERQIITKVCGKAVSETHCILAWRDTCFFTCSIKLPS